MKLFSKQRTIYDKAETSEYSDLISFHPESVEMAIDIVKDVIEAAQGLDMQDLEDSIDTLAKYFDVLDDYRTIDQNGNTYLDLQLVACNNFQH
jgi:hypothetical protein